MAENKNDQQFRQSRSDQQENRGSQQNPGGQNREGTSSGSQMDSELYEENYPNTEENQGSQPYHESTSSDSPMNREQFEERGSNPSSAKQGSQGRDEYASPDDFDELEDDELEDDEMISRVDVEDDMDILNDDDENPQINRPNIPDSGFNPDSTRNR